MNWLYYLAEANLYLAVFYLCYWLLLKRETHYTLNRVYLLVICLLSALLPLIQLDFLKTQQVYTSGIAYNIAESDTGFTWEDGLLYSYFTGVFILSVQFGIKLYQVQKLMQNPIISTNGYKLVRLDNTDTAFSFFNYLFIGSNTPQTELVTRHELVHIRQKHSADIVFLEMFKIINWFNPLVYLLQNSLKTVHEYIADQQTAIQGTDALTYSTFLVNNAYGLTGSSITHSFYNYNLLKNRIMMLNQKRSGKLARLKYLLALPLCGAMLCQSTLGFSKTYGIIDIGAPKTTVAADTIISPRAPKPDVSKVKFPPPPPQPPRAKKANASNAKLPPPPPPPKSPRKSSKVTEVRLLPPPPPPEPPKRSVKVKAPSKVEQIRIVEAVKTDNQPVNEIRIEEPVSNSAKPVQIRVEPIKKSDGNTFSTGSGN